MPQQFARNFRTYSSEAKVQREMVSSLVRKIASASTRRKWDVTSELGCGTGLLTRELLNAFEIGELNLFDLAPNCTEFLQDVPFASFTSGDLDDLAKLPASDIIVSSSCIQWLKDPKRLFRIVRDALPQNGIFAVGTFTEGNLAEIELCGGSPLKCPPASVWRGWLEECGFRILSFEAYSRTLLFGSALESLRHLKRTGVLIPSADGYRDVKRFLDRYDLLRTDGKIPLTYTPVLWVAEKTDA